MKLFLVRHGETQQAGNGTYGYEAPLTDLGRQQAELACEVLGKQGVTKVVSSTAVRALQTAEPLESALGLETIQVSEFLEIDIGVLAHGVVKYEPRYQGGLLVSDFSHVGGETFVDFSKRVISGLDVLQSHCEPDESVSLFTHGGVKNVLMDRFSGRPPSVTMKTLYLNCSISTVETDWQTHTVHSENVYSHLGELAVVDV